MRIIHTSDWHLGQHFMGKSRAAEHQAFLGWLLVQIESHAVDALIVAGDVFDTGSPPSYAREMYHRFIVEIQKKNCQFVVLAGNHDSVATLNESKALLACLNTQVVPSVSDNIADQVIPLRNQQGEIAGILCAVPFIRPRDVMLSKAGQSGKDKQQALQDAIAAHYQDVYEQAVEVRDHYETTTQALPIIGTGHLTTVGVSTSESVRDIYIGTLDAFPASAFPPVSYMALGHIHQSQKVSKSEHIRYSGSPIPLSFDETGKQQGKSVLRVDFKGRELHKVKALKIPCFQPMKVVKGDLDSVELQISQLASSDCHAEDKPVWLEILVTTQDYLNDLQQRVQQLTADKPVEVLLLRRDRTAYQPALSDEKKETLNELSVSEVFDRRLRLEDWKTDGSSSSVDDSRVERIKHSFQHILEEIELGTLQKKEES